MKNVQLIKRFFKQNIIFAQQQGYDLSKDSVEYKFTYPEHPGIVVSIKLGGLFMDYVDFDNNDEELQ